MIKRLTLACDHCDIEYEPELDSEITEEEVMEMAYNEDWIVIHSWFGERTYCSIDCLRIGFNI